MFIKSDNNEFISCFNYSDKKCFYFCFWFDFLSPNTPKKGLGHNSGGVVAIDISCTEY